MPDWDDLAKRIAESGSGGGSTATPDQPPVFFGKEKSKRFQQDFRKPAQGPPSGAPRNGVELFPRRDGDHSPWATTEKKKFKPLDEALGEFYSWDDAERRKWGEYLVEVGYLDAEDADDYQSLLQAWNEVVGEAAQFSTAGRDVDPWMAAKIIAGTDESGMTKAARERGFTGTRSTRQESVDLTDPTTARAAINQTLARFLGRYANDDELATFTETLNRAERENPIVTNTSTSFEDGEATGSKSTKSGGIDGGQVLEDEAMSTPDYGAYQAASTYYGALLSAIQSPV